MHITLPHTALEVLQALEDAGYPSYVVGGYVRDALRGANGSDIDIATAAHWQSVRDIAQAHNWRWHETGVKHGTITILVRNDETDSADAYEVTTFRADGSYTDSRHPDEVTFVRTIEEDLARRDFTINALAYHPQQGLVDPYGGVSDLDAHLIRAVGDPKKRFHEDALRILRGCRFASQLGFAIDPATYQAMMESKGQLYRVSAERVSHELELLLLGNHVHDALMQTIDVLAAVLPEPLAMKGFEQDTPYHIYDVWEHTAYVVQHSPATRLSRWTALFHDMGKPACHFNAEDGVGHFYNHAKVSMVLAEGIMRRLKMSPSFAAKVLKLVERHDDVIEETPHSVKRALARLDGNTDLFRALCAIKKADALSQAPQCATRVDHAVRLEQILDDILAQDEAFSLKDLAIDGHDLMKAGYPQGPLLGELLHSALDAVIDEQVANEKESLLAYIGPRNAH